MCLGERLPTPGKSGNRTSQVLELRMDDYGVNQDSRDEGFPLIGKG